MSWVRQSCAAVALATLVVAPVASAQPTPAERALATTLFREAKKLMADKKWAEACPKLAESQRLDPGGGTLLNLALCHEQEGKTATAWAEFNEALAMARRDARADREQTAREHVEKLEPLLPRLTLVVPAASDVPDLEIVLDAVVVRRAAWGTATPVDPGRHTLRASAAGREPWAWQGEVAASQSISVEVPALVALPAPPVAPDPTPAPAPSPAAFPPPFMPPVQPVVPDRPPPPRDATHDGQLGAVARVDVDGKLRGAVFAVGPTFGLTRHLDVELTALLGGSPGVAVGGSLFVLTGAWKPTLAIDVPVHFEDGAHPGVHPRAGLQWDPHRNIGALVQLGLQYFPTAPAGFDEVVFVPSAGLHGRL